MEKARLTVEMNQDQVREFRRLLSGFEQFHILEPNTPYVVSSPSVPEAHVPIKELSWQEELQDLRSLVGRMHDAIETDDEAKKSMRRWYFLEKRKLEEENPEVPDNMSLSAFSDHVKRLIDYSVFVYEAQSDRPRSYERVKKNIYYKRLQPDVLNPREVRMIIRHFKLTGKTVDHRMIRYIEGNPMVGALYSAREQVRKSIISELKGESNQHE